VNRNVPHWLRTLAWIGVCIWVTTITILSSMTPPQLEAIAPFQLWDKAEHFIAFAAGAVNLALALRWGTEWPWKKIVRFTIIAISVFGAVDEIHQLFTPHRSGADPFDWMADTLGAAFAAIATALIHARYSRPHRPAPAGA
jgi:VanZ family protein